MTIEEKREVRGAELRNKFESFLGSLSDAEFIVFSNTFERYIESSVCVKTEIEDVRSKLTKHKTVAIDFDGVLHHWNGKWEGATSISGTPVEGALDWLTALVEDDQFDIVIFSSRCLDSAFETVVKTWFIANGLREDIARKLVVTKYKFPFWLTIDDRAHCFDGTHFPSSTEIAKFVPWYNCKL